jgi:hypothetical protein
VSKPPIKMRILLILILLTGETMAHVKGHINVPAQKASSNEVKDSFFTSFKKKIFGETKKQGITYSGGYPGIKVKLYKKGGKVSK